MARVQLKQPDGKYAEFSTIVGGFIEMNMTREELIAMKVDEARLEITDRVNDACDALDSGKVRSSYYTWDTALAEHIMRHGPVEETFKCENQPETE